MARLQLSKAQLAREVSALGRYRRYLPALDLKRKQLVAERNRARTRLAETEAAIAARAEAIGAEIPMLANAEIDLVGLARVERVKIGERNLVGVRVPVLEALEVSIAPYGLMLRPHWVDLAARRLAEVVRLEVEARLLRREIELIDAAVTKVMQRVNLFEKVLIPRATANIARIRIALGDMERAGVVTSKIAKRKREAAA